MADIDKIDRRILAILQGDGRIANVELAERIGLSPTSIGERLKRLQREGFIEGYGARLNPHRLGLGLLVFVEVLLDKTTPDIFERFARAVQNAPEVVTRVWQTAADLGYGGYFLNDIGDSITDDHLPLQKKGIHVIDVIDIQYGPLQSKGPLVRSSPNYHHTQQDTFDKISAKSLQIVGDVAMTLVK